MKGKLILIENIYPMSGLLFIGFETPIHNPHIESPAVLSLVPLTYQSEAVSYSVHHTTTKYDLA